MKHAVVMGSGVMIYITNIIKISSAIHKLIRGIHKDTESMDIA
jgi:hypothetical protein